MSNYRISVAADLLGVSPDTVRRWIQIGKLGVDLDNAGRQTISGKELAKLAQELAPESLTENSMASSARNRAPGLVTEIIKDKVMAQVNLQCGPFRFVSLMSREAVEDLNLQVGDIAAAVVKATTVIVEKQRDLKENSSK